MLFCDFSGEVFLEIFPKIDYHSTMEYHTSVLLHETVDGLNIQPTGTYVDGTTGGGGHMKEIAKQANKVIAIDRDTDALKEAAKHNCGNVSFVHGNFSDIEQILLEQNITDIQGMVIDLGVSSFQLNNAARGFSYMNNGPLDMRMDKTQPLSAHTVVNFYPPEKLVALIKLYGEEPFAKKIVRNLVAQREKAPLETTRELFELIEKSVPKKLGLAPIKRVFQAIRIEVNNELGIIEDTIATAIKHMSVGGRLCIITFHSLEDRIVKHAFNKLANPCTCPREFPLCACGKLATVKVISRRPILPSQEEMAVNSRSRSAKLRIAERV